MSSKKNKKSLVPKRRFPEFRVAEKWTEAPFEKVFTRITTKNSENHKNSLTISAQDGLVSQLDYFNKKISAQDLTGYYLLHKGEFAYNKSYSQGYPMGAIKRLNLYEKGVVSTLYICFRIKTGYSGDFFEHYFDFGMLNDEISKIAQEGARNHGLLNVGVHEFFENTIVRFPKLPEQQRIADCLSSLDEVIELQRKKVEALTDYKDGFMQRLFPREDQSIPELRFSGFKGKWEEIKLGQLGELIGGLTYSPDDVRDEGLLVLRSSNIQDGQISLDDNVYVDPNVKGANLSQPDDILICVRNGSKALIGKNALIPKGMPLCTHGAFMTVFRSKSPKFVFQLFQTTAYQKQVDGDLGATINSINGSQFVRYKFYIPNTEAEQQKIADFLSSLDQVIAAQSQKLNVLKEHKKGLMQQLFPLLAGAEA